MFCMLCYMCHLYNLHQTLPLYWLGWWSWALHSLESSPGSLCFYWHAPCSCQPDHCCWEQHLWTAGQPGDLFLSIGVRSNKQRASLRVPFWSTSAERLVHQGQALREHDLQDWKSGEASNDIYLVGWHWRPSLPRPNHQIRCE